MNRTIIARFSTLLEAEAAVSSLNAAGIESSVDNEIAGGMMPHASEAFGGFQVSVDASQKDAALSLLEGAVVEEKVDPVPMSNSRKVEIAMKRAAYGAAMGCIFLPVIANLFSLAMYFRAYRLSRDEFKKHPGLFAFGMFFNVFAFVILFCFLVFIVRY